MVNAIGTIPIYFPTPARDIKSGLAINQAGCQHLNGDQALAYVRSRYYESFVNGQWQPDPTSDLGRIKRQQYFLRTLAQQTLHAASHEAVEGEQPARLDAPEPPARPASSGCRRCARSPTRSTAPAASRPRRCR